ncbi:hypothetical protein GXW74_12765 [Roseomonas eburnea]|uniref:Uncharacterized protein n=1 Tax=Neoroseomonas eburnea TaxID=1346889 RepID=A0A9X9XCC4_9PROT|nr:hypothetical protein [Neoroseomonas eburnea]MBR0681360.1 hypothetical protein [Neoroseomonas eburnea]
MTAHSWFVANVISCVAWSLDVTRHVWRRTDRSVPFLEFVVGTTTPMRLTRGGPQIRPEQHGPERAQYWRGQVARFGRVVVPGIVLQVSVATLIAGFLLPLVTEEQP